MWHLFCLSIWNCNVLLWTHCRKEEFCFYGPLHRRPILIIFQRDAIQSSLFIILKVHSTCFGCQQHTSSGVHKTVTTASGTGHIFLCSYLPPTCLTWPRCVASCRTIIHKEICSWQLCRLDSKFGNISMNNLFRLYANLVYESNEVCWSFGKSSICQKVYNHNRSFSEANWAVPLFWKNFFGKWVNCNTSLYTAVIFCSYLQSFRM